MKIAQGDQLKFVRGLQHRGGTIHFRYLMDGEPGTPGNFSLVLAKSEGDFYSPRHKHNFEQIRFLLEGFLDFGRTGKLTPGMIGYFPEGVAYGPQTQLPGHTSLALVLQYGGASGSGYLSRAQVKAGMEELRQFGDFKDGVYRRKPGVPGKRNLDGFQAIWEHLNQRPLVYPKPRYDHPVFMDPAACEWVPLEGSDGAREKLLGVFTERRSEFRLVRLERGASHRAKGRAIYVVLSGSGTVDGQPARQFTTVHADTGDSPLFAAREGLDLVQFGLPDLTAFARGSLAQAAE